MGNIVTLLGARHIETQSLLPWYVSGRLETHNRTQVEAHLVECPECRADLATERRLAAEWVATPLESEASWRRLRERLVREDVAPPTATALSRLAGAARDIARRWWSPISGWGWVLAAIQGLVLVAIVASLRTATPAAQYHTLGAAPAPSVGNVLVMFNPETSVRRFREALEASHARLVDGPTASGAYVLHVPADERAAVLTGMRERTDVELAQPIDPGVTR